VRGGDVQVCRGLLVVYELPEQYDVCSGFWGQQQLRLRSWFHGGCCDCGELCDVRSGDVQGWHWLCDVHELPDARGVYRGKHDAEQLQV